MNRRFALAVPALVLAGLAACTARPPAHVESSAAQAAPAGQDGMMPFMKSASESYVHLVLELGERDAGYVDAYYGPPEWKTEAAARHRSLGEIRAEAQELVARLAALDLGSAEEIVRLRRSFLARQLQALSSRTEMLEGRKLTFDEESQALYDAVAPHHTAADFEKTLAELDALLPGSGERAQRIDALRQAFVIPPAKLDAVFSAAIAECQRRTRAHVSLPAKERFTVEYVTGKPWSAYNWYKGDDRSVIQVNTELPVTLDRAVDLACHEGYPGHHVYNLSLEEALVRGRGWMEYTVYPLFSPQSLIAEGTANFGIEVAFPGEERVAFDTELARLAGLDTARVADYARVQKLLAKLSYAGNEAARQYLDGSIDASAAADWLERYALTSPRARAEQRVRFFDTYRAYVINYNLGQDLVRKYVEAHGGTPENPARRWQVFAELLASPRLPSDLR
jgi:hypothetical protein